METDFPAPELSLTDLNELHNDLIEMQRVVILCTIALIAAFVIIVPPLIYLYFRNLPLLGSLESINKLIINIIFS